MLRLILVGVLLGLAALASGPSHSADARGHSGDGVPAIGGCIDFNEGNCADLDGDGYIGAIEIQTGSDPDNAASTPEYGLLDEQFPPHQTCDDDVDNDLDGRTDRRDRGCRITCRDFAPRLVCTDKDRDGWIKYMELGLASDPKNRESTPEALGGWALAATCGDGVDNDRDTLIDADDPGCNPPPIGECIDFDASSLCDPCSDHGCHPPTRIEECIDFDASSPCEPF